MNKILLGALVVLIVLIVLVIRHQNSPASGKASPPGQKSMVGGEEFPPTQTCHHLNSRSFPDPDGYCYTCPKGYIRTPWDDQGLPTTVTGPKACANTNTPSPTAPGYTHATRIGQWATFGAPCHTKSGTIWPFSGCDVSAGICCEGKCARECKSASHPEEGKACHAKSGTIWPFSGCDVSAGICCHGRCAKKC